MTEPTEADVALVLSCYDAFARGDIDAAVAPLHPDVDWVEPDEFPNGGAHRGPAAVAAYLSASRDSWETVRTEATAHVRGPNVVVVHHVVGRTRDGVDRDVTVADVFTVVNGQVTAMRAYADPVEALASYE